MASCRHRRCRPLNEHKVTLFDQGLDLLDGVLASLPAHLLLLLLGLLAFDREVAVQEQLQSFAQALVLQHYALVPAEVLLVCVSVFDGVPELVVSVEALPDLSFGGGFDVGDLEACFDLLQVHSHHFSFAETVHEFFEELLITVADHSPAVLILILLELDHSLNKVGRGCRLQEPVGEVRNPVGLNILLDHPGELDDLLPGLLLLVLNLSGQFQRLVLLTEDEVLEFLEVELLHVDLLLAGALRVVVLVALRVLTLDRRPTSALLACEALVPEPPLLDVFNALDADHAVLLLEVALGHPNRTHVVHPDVVAGGHG